MKTFIVSLLLLCSASVSAQDVTPLADCYRPRLVRITGGAVYIDCAQEPKEPHEKLFHVAIAGGMVLQGIDIAQSMYVFGAGKGSELNPVLAPCQHKPACFGAVDMALKTITSYTLLKMHSDGNPTHRKIAIGVLVASYVIEGIAIASNQRIVNKVGR